MRVKSVGKPTGEVGLLFDGVSGMRRKWRAAQRARGALPPFEEVILGA